MTKRSGARHAHEERNVSEDRVSSEHDSVRVNVEYLDREEFPHQKIHIFHLESLVEFRLDICRGGIGISPPIGRCLDHRWSNI